MNMPGLTAEDSLYVSSTQYGTTAHHYWTRPLDYTRLERHTIVPQRKVKMPFLSCGKCRLDGSFMETYLGLGGMECCDFYCDIPPIHGKTCWTENCRREPCTTVGGSVFD